VPLAFCLGAGAGPLEAPDLGLVPVGSRRCELSSKRKVALVSRDLLAHRLDACAVAIVHRGVVRFPQGRIVVFPDGSDGDDARPLRKP
jgi:hypothetical protein